MLIVFCAMIGMFMAWNSETSQPFSLQLFFWATLGIAMLSAAAAVVNCLIEKQIDAKMARTAWRPLPSGNLSPNTTPTYITNAFLREQDWSKLVLVAFMWIRNRARAAWRL